MPHQTYFLLFSARKREEVTTEGGLDVAGQKQKVADAVKRLTDAGILVSLFIDADHQQIDAAQECGAPFIEIHTGAYADAKSEQEQELEFRRILMVPYMRRVKALKLMRVMV